MFVYIQYARAIPVDWELLNITTDGDWRTLIKKDEPADGDPGTKQADAGGGFGIKTVLDEAHVDANEPGWLNALSVQGIVMRGSDHINLDVDGGRLVVTRWNDDLDDWAGERYAQEWTFRLPVVDGRTGILEPRMSLSVWGEAQTYRDKYSGQRIGAGEFSEAIVVDDWAEFNPPGPNNMIMHGIWLEESLAAAHTAVQTDPSFDRWLTGS